MEAKKLNDIRKKAGISVDELANLASLPKSTVEKILFGIVQHPRVDTMEALERALGLAPEWTDEEIALGVGKHPIALSDEDEERLQLLWQAEDVLGKEATKAYLSVLQIMIENRQKKP